MTRGPGKGRKTHQRGTQPPSWARLGRGGGVSDGPRKARKRIQRRDPAIGAGSVEPCAVPGCPGPVVLVCASCVHEGERGAEVARAEREAYWAKRVADLERAPAQLLDEQAHRDDAHQRVCERLAGLLQGGRP